MSLKLEFCFDFVSPMSYFAFHKLKGLKERTGCDVEYIPVSLQQIMVETGNRPPGTVEAKRNFYFADTIRHAKRYNLPWGFNPNFPMKTFRLLCMAQGLMATDQAQDFMKTIFHHSWGEPRNVGDKAVMWDLLSADGFDADKLYAMSDDQVIKDRVKANTDRAIARGMFGAPTFFVGDELYFGQDRMDFVEDALTARAWV
tara:strand:+ start:11071 stop:11670 length:600 start_codon:yes stop_codon:yes gene_type:complete